MWSELPNQLVELIMDELAMTTDISNDYIRCGAVCTSWRDVFIHHSHPDLLRHRLRQPPLLIVPTPLSSSSKKKKKHKKQKNTKSLSFYNCINRKVYNDQFHLTIPSNTHFRGCSHGWLVAVDQGDYDCQVRLFNPFTNSNILLPSTKNFPFKKYPCTHTHGSPSTYAYLRKVVLSADPLSNPTGYIVMAIFGGLGSLAFYKPGCDEKWNLVEIESSKLSHDMYAKQFHDVIYYQGKFMALNFFGVILVLDPALNMKVISEISRPLRPSLPYDLVYLVETASGHLLQIQRFMEVGKLDIVTKREHYKTSNFRVLKLEAVKSITMEEEEGIDDQFIFQNATCKVEEGINQFVWMELESIGKQTLFLGNSDTMCISSDDCDDFPRCKPNSIYFTDDFMDFYYRAKWNGPHDLGIFNLEDGTIQNHYPTDHYTPIWPIPIWIQPSIQKRGGGEGINMQQQLKVNNMNATSKHA